MKKLLLLVLLIALGAGAYVSKPPDAKRSFVHYLKEHENQNELIANLTAETCEFQDRILWVDVTQSGKTIYTNVFHRWINRAEVKHAVEHDLHVAKREVEDAKDKLVKP